MGENKEKTEKKPNRIHSLSYLCGFGVAPPELRPAPACARAPLVAAVAPQSSAAGVQLVVCPARWTAGSNGQPQTSEGPSLGQ